MLTKRGGHWRTHGEDVEIEHFNTYPRLSPRLRMPYAYSDSPNHPNVVGKVWAYNVWSVWGTTQVPQRLRAARCALRGRISPARFCMNSGWLRAAVTILNQVVRAQGCSLLARGY